jgi:hypothetical protein
MPIVETKWTLDVDTATGRAQFKVEYHSEFPAARHEDIHRELRERAQELLRKLGIEHPGWGREGAVLVVRNSETREEVNYEMQTRKEAI